MVALRLIVTYARLLVHNIASSNHPLNVLNSLITVPEIADLHSIILVLIVVVGLALLTYGGDFLARGGASLAMNMDVSPVVIGLTVVSIATSMPEFFAVIVAAIDGNSEMAIGNILGSNLGNIGLIMGMTAIIYPVFIHNRLILKEMPILLAATIVFTAVAVDQHLSRLDGILLVLGMVGYLYYMVKSARGGETEIVQEALVDIPKPVRSTWASLVFVIIGAVMLGAGAQFLVGSAVELAVRIGISQSLIGLTLVALGTSLPELAASVAAARRKESGLSAGNIVGSNIFNLLFVGGGVAIISPFSVGASLFQIEFPAMMLMTALLWLIYTTDKKVTRLEGIVLLLIYITIIALSAIANIERYQSFV